MIAVGSYLRILLHALLLASTSTVRSQSQWGPAGLPGLAVGQLRQVYSNPARNTIYYCGAISFTGTGLWQQSNSVMRYTNGQWDTLGVLNGQVFSVVLYNDTLIAGGQFSQCSGLPCPGIAFHDGNGWQPYGTIEGPSIRKLRVLDGVLYAVGGFNSVDGQTASGVAKRVGGSWVPVGLLPTSGGILDIIKYDGELVIIGGGVNIDGVTDIARWNGEEWYPLGPGIVNPMSGAHCLAVYQGDLYVGGQIALAPGNPGQNIMRWDGSQFHSLSQGVQQWLGNTTGIASVFALAEHNGKLFVGGGYRAAGGIEALGLATWDGTQWCAVPGDFRESDGIWSMAFYQDTLFVVCGAELDGQPVNRAAKFMGEEYEMECSGPVGVMEWPASPRAPIIVHPNPGFTYFQLQGLGPRPALVQLRDVQGRIVQRTNTVVDLQPIGASTLPAGVYLVEVIMENGRYVLRWVKE